MQRLTRQLGQAAELYRRTGASAFVVLVASDYEIAYLAYPTTAATRKVLDSAEGKAVAAEGQGFMNTVLYAPALPFNGAAKPGDAFNVQFGLQPNAARGP